MRSAWFHVRRGIFGFARTLPSRTLASLAPLSNRQSIGRRSLYNFALTRTIPNSFVNSLSKYYEASSDSEPISIQRAKLQHDCYVKILRTRLPTMELPPLEIHPDSVFVEDTVVAYKNRALITWPGHVSRQGEVSSIQQVLEQLGMDVWIMNDRNPKAVCDGGDVLTTDRHMFVGLSNRTNEEGAMVLQEAFEKINSNSFDNQTNLMVIPVSMDSEDALHLKSIVSHLDDSTLLAPDSAVGDKVVKAMDALGLGYEVIRLPDIRACNVVSVNGMIIASNSICDKSREMLQQAVKERSMEIEFVETTEIAKSDGSCTCCSVLLRL